MSCATCNTKSKFDPSLCPVRQVIEELNTRGGQNTSLKLSVSYGDMEFLISCKKLELARFKLSKPKLKECIARFVLPAPSFAEYYRQVAISPSQRMFVALFVRVYDMIKYNIMQANPKASTVNAPIFSFDTRAFCLIPKVMTDAVNWIVNMVGTIDSQKKIDILPDFTEDFPSGEFPEIPDTLDADSAMSYLEKYQEAEFIVLNYAVRVEAYQAQAYELLEGIKDSFTS